MAAIATAPAVDTMEEEEMTAAATTAVISDCAEYSLMTLMTLTIILRIRRVAFLADVP